MSQELAALVNSDPETFLKAYLSMAADNPNLQIPARLDEEGARQGWEQILPQIGAQPTPEFLGQLSKTWLQVIQKQGGQLNETFAQDCLAILEGKTPAKPQSDPAQPTQNQPAAQAQPPAESKPDPISEPISDVQPQISSDYHQDQAARSEGFPPVDSLQKLVGRALRQADMTGFLIHHLTYAHYNQAKEMPKTSIIQQIRDQWDVIVQDGYDVALDPEALKELSAIWFNLVHQKGLPTTKDRTLEFVYHLRQKYTPPEKVDSPTQSGAWQWLKSKLG